MATTPQTAYEPHAGAPSDLQEKARRHLWMHFTRMGAYDADHEIPIIVRGEGCYVYDEHGKRYLDGLSALFCVNAGHGRAELGDAAAAQAKELGFFTNWSYAPSARDRAGRPDRIARPRGPQPGVLHLRRLGGRGVGLEAVAGLPQAPRRHPEDEDHRPRDGLPRHHLRGALDHRHHAAAHALRAARARRPSRAEHERLPLGRGPRPALGRRPDRAQDRVRGPRDGGRGDPRAGAELGRLVRAPGRLLPARPRDLRPPRRAADLGRGDLRLGPARALLRLRSASTTCPTSSPRPRASRRRTRRWAR